MRYKLSCVDKILLEEVEEWEMKKKKQQTHFQPIDFCLFKMFKLKNLI